MWLSILKNRHIQKVVVLRDFKLVILGVHNTNINVGKKCGVILDRIRIVMEFLEHIEFFHILR